MWNQIGWSRVTAVDEIKIFDNDEKAAKHFFLSLFYEIAIVIKKISCFGWDYDYGVNKYVDCTPVIHIYLCKHMIRGRSKGVLGSGDPTPVYVSF